MRMSSFNLRPSFVGPHIPLRYFKTGGPGPLLGSTVCRIEHHSLEEETDAETDGEDWDHSSGTTRQHMSLLRRNDVPSRVAGGYEA